MSALLDDKDLDDAALRAVIDSAAAASYSSTTSPTTTTSHNRKPLTLKNSTFRSPPQFHSPSPPLSHHKPSKSPRQFISPYNSSRPHKIFRPASSLVSDTSESSPEAAIVKHVPIKPVFSPEIPRNYAVNEISPYGGNENVSPNVEHMSVEDRKDQFTHCLSGRFPTVSLFKDYQDAAMAILEKTDYTMISGNPYIKKTGWRKIAFYFNLSFEIKEKTIKYDENDNVVRAEFVARAYMQGGRFSDGWGSCERREKKFMKPNNDIPSTAETRAKNRACQDLLGIGQYRPGAGQSHSFNPR